MKELFEQLKNASNFKSIVRLIITSPYKRPITTMITLFISSWAVFLVQRFLKFKKDYENDADSLKAFNSTFTKNSANDLLEIDEDIVSGKAQGFIQSWFLNEFGFNVFGTSRQINDEFINATRKTPKLVFDLQPKELMDELEDVYNKNVNIIKNNVESFKTSLYVHLKYMYDNSFLKYFLSLKYYIYVFLVSAPILIQVVLQISMDNFKRHKPHYPLFSMVSKAVISVMNKIFNL